MSDATIILRGGTIVDPLRGTTRAGDIWMRDGRIVECGTDAGDAQVLDVGGQLVMPGLIDMHVHLREPGYEYKETVQTGVRAAAAGGFTAVACMANTKPVNDSGAVTEFIIERARVAGGARVYPIGAVSVGMQGERLAEVGEMHRAGIVAISDDGLAVMDSGLMRRALEYAQLFNLPVIVHEEDRGLACGGVMHEGEVSVRLGLRGIPSAAEDVMVARDIALAELTGGHVHIAHVSTAGAVALVREARSRGVRVTAEVTPHHLFLTDEAVRGYDTNAKMAPPLRTARDVAAVRAGLADGTIEAIATDHAPHHHDEKACEFDHAANGVVGLETALGLGLRLVSEGVLDLPTLIARMSTGPARILGIPGGTLAVGAAADVTVVDATQRWTVVPKQFRSKSRNTPFGGWDLAGRPTLVFVGGRLVHEEERPVTLRSAS